MKSLLLSSTLLFSFAFLNAQLTTLHTCGNDTLGREPNSGLVSDGTYLYGTTRIGGDNGLGMIYKIKPDGTGYEDVYDWAMPTTGGNDPQGTLLLIGNTLYGMTYQGGNNDMGTIYKVNTNGTGFVKLLDFDGMNNGSDPMDALISDGTFLYGVTSSGGANDNGTIFKIMPDGTGYQKLLDFNQPVSGNDPWGSLTYDGTFLYGTTFGGGTSNVGTIFKIMPDGTGYLKLHDFSGAPDGYGASTGLYDDGTFLYGMCQYGGTSSMGTLCKIMHDGTGFVKLLDFTGAANGANSLCDLTSAGGFIYGMTSLGGTNGMGTMFKILPDGTGYVKLLDFDGGGNGAAPLYGLYNDGTYFYGTTSLGGSNTIGTIFGIQHSFVGIEENDHELSMDVYPNPTDGELNIVVENELENAGLEIFNMVGQSLMSINHIHLQSGESYRIDMSSLDKGTYLVKLNNYYKVVIKD